MQDTIHAGNVLIKEGTLLPDALRIESQPCVPGWKLVADFDGHGLDREIQRTGWTFFCLAGVLKTTVFGMNRQKMLRRAIRRILARTKPGNFNSLEITRVVPKHFFGVPYTNVDARSRHIQESFFLPEMIQ